MVQSVLAGIDGLDEAHGTEEVLWLDSVKLARPRRPSAMPFLLKSVTGCALLAGTATAGLLFGGWPPGVPGAAASVSALTLDMPFPDSPGRTSFLAASVPETPAVVPATGLSGDAVAAISADPAAEAIDHVSPQSVVASVEAAGPTDPDEMMTFGPMRLRRWLVETIVRAAKETESDPVLLMAIADKESSFITHVKAKTSSAEGLFQFITQTWLKVVRDFGPKHGLAKEAALVTGTEDGFDVEDAAEKTRILELRRDPYLAAVLAAEMLRHDGARIARKIGRELTHGEIYIAHFLGPDDASSFMEKVVATPGAVAANLLPRPAKANRPIFYAAGRRKPRGLSVAQVHKKFEEMMGLRADRYRAVAGMGAVGLGVGGALAYADASVK